MKLGNLYHNKTKLTIILLFLSLTPLVSFADSSVYKSPLKQLKEGVLPQNVQCNSGFELVFKSGTNLPVCIKPETKQRLIESGWAQYAFPIIFETDKFAYKLGESIKITMKNIGSNTLKTSSTPIGFSIYDENDKRVCTWNGPNLQVGLFASGETLTEILDDEHECSDLSKDGPYSMKPGLYKIKADHFHEFGLWLNYHGPVHQIRVTEINDTK